mmetsp:Transcript_12525/g.41304  ORF Transcript_12525/g.41304 Transcript_12525/m.41304 type:complete len:253 (+) Transcript_12525:380-1138(+)
MREIGRGWDAVSAVETADNKGRGLFACSAAHPRHRRREELRLRRPLIGVDRIDEAKASDSGIPERGEDGHLGPSAVTCEVHPILHHEPARPERAPAREIRHHLSDKTRQEHVVERPRRRPFGRRWHHAYVSETRQPLRVKGVPSRLLQKTREEDDERVRGLGRGSRPAQAVVELDQLLLLHHRGRSGVIVARLPRRKGVELDDAARARALREAPCSHHLHPRQLTNLARTVCCVLRKRLRELAATAEVELSE